MRKNTYQIIIVLVVLICGCSKHNSVSSAKEFSAWINDVENGCKVQKDVNGMILEVKYLPPSFLALKDLESSHLPETKLDSLLENYKYSTTFLLTFKPHDGEAGQDIMFKDVSNYKEYVERSLTLNFDLETKMILKTEKSQFSPVLSSLENTYGLSKGRSVYMVFSENGQKGGLTDASAYDLIYTDDIYQLGILHFMFDHQSIIKNIPDLSIHHS